MRFAAVSASLALAGALYLLAPSAPSNADEKPPRKGATEEAPAVEDTTTEGPRQPHTLYDDHGALDWRKKLEDSQALAKRRRKLIFIEYGRET